MSTNSQVATSTRNNDDEDSLPVGRELVAESSLGRELLGFGGVEEGEDREFDDGRDPPKR